MHVYSTHIQFAPVSYARVSREYFAIFARNLCVVWIMLWIFHIYLVFSSRCRTNPFSIQNIAVLYNVTLQQWRGYCSLLINVRTSVELTEKNGVNKRQTRQKNQNSPIASNKDEPNWYYRITGELLGAFGCAITLSTNFSILVAISSE